MKREPTWTKGSVFFNWAMSLARKSVWRVGGLDADDLMQEFAVCFLRVESTYPEVTDPPHFMRLFQRACNNRLHDLARKKQRAPEVVLALDDPAVPVGATEGLAEFEVALAEAPVEIQNLVAAAQAGGDSFCRYSNGTRENRNAVMCRLAGVEGVDMMSVMKNWLQSEFNLAWG